MHSVSPPVFVLGDEFAFSTEVFKTNGFQYNIGLSSLITDYGFLIPYNTLSFNIIDALDTKGQDYQVQTVVRGMILDHRGYLYEISIGEVEQQLCIGDSKQDPAPTSVKLNKNRLLYGKGTYFARGYNPDQEATAQAAMSFSKSLDEAIKMYCKSSIESFADFKQLKFSEVTQLLKEEKRTKPINFHRPSPEPSLLCDVGIAIKDLPFKP